MKTITIEIKPQRGRVVIASGQLLIEDASGNTAVFNGDDVIALSAALIDAEAKRRELPAPNTNDM